MSPGLHTWFGGGARSAGSDVRGRRLGTCCGTSGAYDVVVFFVLRPVVAVLSAVGRLVRMSEARPAAAAPGPPVLTSRRRTAAGDATQVLVCEPGGHQWQRPAKPGRKPRACPEHA